MCVVRLLRQILLLCPCILQFPLEPLHLPTQLPNLHIQSIKLRLEETSQVGH